MDDQVRRQLEELWRYYFPGVMTIVGAGIRGAIHESHLLSYLHVDLEQSMRAIPLLAAHHIYNVGRREIRFIFEASVKICDIEQRGKGLDVESKLKQFEKDLDNPRISAKDRVRLDLLAEDMRAAFRED